MALLARKERVEIGWAVGGANSLAVSMDGLVAKVGEGDYEAKLKRLFELEGEIAQRKINAEYVDLRFSDRVVVKALPPGQDEGEKGKAAEKGQKEAHEEKVPARP
jgi:cell division septal protein FtsQ